MSALAALKTSDELISESLKTELDATRKKLAQKTFELDEMKEQLMGALVSKDKIRRQLDDAIASASTEQPTPEETPKYKKEDPEKVEKLKAALRQKIEVSNNPDCLRFLSLSGCPAGIPDVSGRSAHAQHRHFWKSRELAASTCSMM